MEDIPDVSISVIGQTLENYITMKIDHLVIKDSRLFMNASLDSLVNNLSADGEEHFNILKDEYQQHYQLLRKRVFPYDFLSDEDKLNYPCLRPKKAFYNKLTDEELSDEDYEHARNVWDTFNISSFKEYMEFYVKTDVLLLACVFENFRRVATTIIN